MSDVALVTIGAALGLLGGSWIGFRVALFIINRIGGDRRLILLTARQTAYHKMADEAAILGHLDLSERMRKKARVLTLQVGLDITDPNDENEQE